jgi:two-component system osmolarity sensor histidine kinase EnvZ
MKLPGTLLWRTLAVLVVALAASQAISLWLLYENVTRPRAAMGMHHFVAHLKTIRAALQTLPADAQGAFIARIAEKEGLRILPVRGNERARPAPDVGPVPMFREQIRSIFGPEAEVYVRPNAPMALWVRVPAATRDWWIAFPRQRIERDPMGALIGWSVAGLAIAVLATFLIVWWLSRPLRSLAEAAEKLGKGGDPPPIPEKGPSEIRTLARAFNQMKEDLKRQERERSTFLAGISHDLRTPLARLRLETEMLGGKVDAETQKNMVSDLEDMNAIIDQFIGFARSEAAEVLAPVNLSDAARSAAERAARLGTDVKCDLADVPVLMLRPLAIQRLLENLIGNAARHGGREILVRTAARDREVQVCVFDRGPGIPPDQVERLKQPFARRDDARSGQSGAGLGLAIANRIALMHGGRLELLARDGGGLEARVSFAAAA